MRVVLPFMFAAAVQAQGWSQRSSPAFTGAFPDIVTDTVRNRLVAVDQRRMTWEWDGTQWREKGLARENGRIAFDSRAGRTLRFGFDTSSYLEEWDGHGWTTRSNSGPLPGASPLVFDAARNRVLMIDFQGQVQEWDGATWTAAGAVPVVGFARLIYDSARQQVLMLSHANIDTPMQTHVRNGSGWQLLATAGPTNPNFGCADDPVRGRLVAHGGGSSAASPGTFEWDGTQWRARGNAPFARRGHTLAFDPVMAQVVAFGGHVGDGGVTTSQTLQDAWAWNGSSWQRVAAWGPPSRVLHAAAWDQARGRLVLFGGRMATTRAGDLWEYDGQQWRSRTVVGGPTPREGHGMAASPTGGIVLFGGYDVAARGDCWHFDGNAWTPIGGALPAARYAHVLALDGVRARIVLHGGASAPFAVLTDTWEYDGQTWRQVATQGPSTPFGVLLGAWSPAEGGVVVHASTLGNGTWLWDGVSWRMIAPNVPNLVQAVGYDPLTVATVLVSRQLSGQVAVLEMNGGIWVPRSMSPSPMQGAFDGAAAATLTWTNRGGMLYYSGTFVQTTAPNPADSAVVGPACGDPAVATPHVSTFGLPRVGDAAFRLDLSGEPAAVGILAFATRPALRPFGSACDWRLDDGPAVLFALDGQGVAVVVAPIADSGSLVGTDMFVQAALPASASARGFVFSAPLRVSLGD